MIVFGAAVTERETYERYAAVGFACAMESDSIVIDEDNDGTLSVGYNRILDRVAHLDHVEAVVLAHQDLQITRADFCMVVRECLRDPELAVIGIQGARNVTDLSWWNPGPVFGTYEWTYREGAPSIPMQEWENVTAVEDVESVDAVDGMIMVLSKWAIDNLRFDTELDPSAHGYDVDLCFQARALDMRVAVANLGAVHHHSLTVMEDYADWIEAHMRLAEKWDTEELTASQWRQRARRAEAETGAAMMGQYELGVMRNESDRGANRAWAWARELQAAVAERDAELTAIRSTRSYRAYLQARGVLRAIGQFPRSR